MSTQVTLIMRRIKQVPHNFFLISEECDASRVLPYLISGSYYKYLIKFYGILETSVIYSSEVKFLASLHFAYNRIRTKIKNLSMSVCVSN